MPLKRSKIKTVSDKITETFLPKASADPEDDPENLIKIADLDDEDDTDALVLNSKPSEIRKRNAKLLSDFSEKYKGKVTSRKELEENIDLSTSEEDLESEDSMDSEDSELEEYRIQMNKNGRGKKEGAQSSEESESESELDDKTSNLDLEPTHSDTSEEDEGDGDDQDDDSEIDEADSDYASSADDENHRNEDTKLLEESNQNSAVEKGLAVQNQLKIWEKLLEIRIHSQKMSIKANSLPGPVVFNQLREKDDNFNKLASESAANLERLLESMLELQHAFASQYSETKELFQSRKKRHSSSNGSDVQPPIKRFATTLSSDFQCMTPYRNSVLRKWDDRTKILTPGARKGNQSLSANFDVIGKVEAVLLNKSDLLAKSQIVKGNYKPLANGNGVEMPNRIGDNEKQDENISSVEIYDDTDFYHQQLRELIEYKSNTSANPAELTKQFTELQKLRQKMKKKVDTRASKGRKLRYVVHKKLVNFMAPDENSEWTDESKTELFRSLFAT